MRKCTRVAVAALVAGSMCFLSPNIVRAVESTPEPLVAGTNEVEEYAESMGPVAAAQAICTAEEWEVLWLTNKERMKNGLQPLSVYDKLQNASNIRKNEITEKFSHERPDGSSCFTALEECDVSYGGAGENIAAGHYSPGYVMSDWMSSTGHRENILGEQYTHLGAGHIKSPLDSSNYWVQLFTGDCVPTKVELEGGSGVKLLKQGETLESLGLVLKTTCEHGTGYLPVMGEMCTGFNPSLPGVEQTVTVSFSGCTTSFLVNIQVPMEKITLNTATLKLRQGSAEMLSVNFVPSNATDARDIQWSTENATVAVVEGGTVTAVSPGFTIITATAGNGMTASCSVTVTGETSGTKEYVYNDVPGDAWFYVYIKDVSTKGIMTGLNNTTFGTYDNLGRAQFATVLYRMGGAPACAYKYQFPDVSDGQFYSVPVTWAHNQKIVSGYENGLFGPNHNISREQMITMLYRYAVTMGIDTSASAEYSGFPDGNKVSPFADQAMKWAVGAGIISGNGDGTLAPQANVNRAVCATIISRFMRN